MQDLIEPQAVGWEYFCDVAYFNMWCVRRVGERTFGQGFHVLNHDSAKALADELARIEVKAAEALTTAQAEIEALKLDLAAQEALWDSAYRAGMKAGWNFCDSRDHEGYLRAQEGTEHIAELKRIRAARAALSGSQP